MSLAIYYFVTNRNSTSPTVSFWISEYFEKLDPNDDLKIFDAMIKLIFQAINTLSHSNNHVANVQTHLHNANFSIEKIIEKLQAFLNALRSRSSDVFDEDFFETLTISINFCFFASGFSPEKFFTVIDSFFV